MVTRIEHVRKITRFDVSNLSEKAKEDYIHMIYSIIQEYEKVDNDLFNQFNNLPDILITDNSDRIKTYCGAPYLGCAYPQGGNRGICSLYFNFPTLESVVISMELAHWAFSDIGTWRETNDVIHYAANVLDEPYIIKGKSLRIWGYTLAEKIKNALIRKPIKEIPLLLYNLPYLVKEKDRIMKEVRNGTAPKGTNPYWSTGTSIPSVRLPQKLLEYISHYESDHDH